MMKSMSWRALGWAAIGPLALLVTFGQPAQAQVYPDKPVKLITQGAAGSGPDVIARIVGEKLAGIWGQQVVIFNHSGAGGSVAARAAAAAPADGYTLYMPASSAFVSMPEMFPHLPFDLDRDFVRIGFVGDQPMIIAVAPSLGVKTLPELVALSKAKPGTILYSANTRGTFPHLTVERLGKVSGGSFTYVPYTGAAAGLQDLMGGRISMISEGPSALAGAIEGGKITPVAVAAAQRLPTMPNVATVAETYPGFVATGWFAMLAPAHTPDAIVRKVNADLKTVLESPDVRKRFLDLGTFARAMRRMRSPPTSIASRKSGGRSLTRSAPRCDTDLQAGRRTDYSAAANPLVALRRRQPIRKSVDMMSPIEL